MGLFAPFISNSKPNEERRRKRWRERERGGRSTDGDRQGGRGGGSGDQICSSSFLRLFFILQQDPRCMFFLLPSFFLHLFLFSNKMPCVCFSPPFLLQPFLFKQNRAKLDPASVSQPYQPVSCTRVVLYRYGYDGLNHVSGYYRIYQSGIALGIVT